jgi:Sortase domain
VSRCRALLALALACAGGVVGCGAPSQSHQTAAVSSRTPGPSHTPQEIGLVPPTVRPLEVGSSGLLAPSGVTASRAPSPTRLRIPAIGVDASLVQLDRKPDGTIEVPDDSSRPGWYSRGPAPGEKGPAVILGHLDSYTGPAVFWHLSSLRPGDMVMVGRQDGSEVSFTVQRLATFPTDGFPTDEVYGGASGPELRLITCGGNFSLARRQYLSNVVAFASLAR